MPSTFSSVIPPPNQCSATLTLCRSLSHSPTPTPTQSFTLFLSRALSFSLTHSLSLSTGRKPAPLPYVLRPALKQDQVLLSVGDRARNSLNNVKGFCAENGANQGQNLTSTDLLIQLRSIADAEFPEWQRWTRPLRSGGCRPAAPSSISLVLRIIQGYLAHKKIPP